MQVDIKGMLPDPTGTPLSNQEIRITNELDSTYTSVFTDSVGNYDFNLLYGTYYIELYIKDSYSVTGTVLVDQGLPSVSTLTELFGYSIFLDPDVILNLPVFWKDKVDAVIEGFFSKARESRDQIVGTNVHIGDIKSTVTSEDGEARLAKNVFDMAACDARIGTEAIVYSDGDGNLTANQGDVITSGSSTMSNEVYLDSDIKSRSYTSTSTLTKDSSTTSYYVGITDEYIVGTSVYKTINTITPSNVYKVLETKVGDNVLNVTEDTSVDSVVLNTTITGPTYSYTQNTEVTPNSVSYHSGSDVNGKISFVETINDGSTSVEEHRVDVLKISREGNVLLEVDTSTDTVYLRGKLRITDLQDADGNPIIPKDGDTIFQVYQYSDTSIGPWEDTLQTYHVWKRENFSVNGVVDPNTWGVPYRFVPEGGEKGEAGDTIYEETEYSADGVTDWHIGILSGDKWRRSRIVINGVAGAWSDAIRIVGDDGSTIETRSEYSIDGVFNWHDTLESTDRYERRAIFVDGEQTGPWSDPFPIGKGDSGDAGDSGDTIFEEHRYGVSENTSDGTWTAWGGTQLDIHFWRQSRVVTNGVADTPGVVHRIVGKPGSGWYTIVGRGGIFPTDAEATIDFINNFGRSPVLDDHLTYVDVAMPNTTTSEVKRCNSPEGSPVTWSTPVLAIQGDVIVRGTMSADRLVANSITGNQISSATTIIAGSGSWTAGMNGNDLASAGDYRYWRFWAGATNPNIAPYRVDRDGNLYADSGRFRGNIELIGTNYMSISSSEGFGSTNQFLEWTGPKAIDSNGDPIMSQIREATAIKYFKTNGDAYFGGSILAGTLKNAAQSSQKATSVSIDTGTYSSNGDIITIKGSIQLSVTVTGTGACPVRNNPVATLKLYSVSSSGAETNVLTHVVTGTYRCVLESGGNIQDYFISGSFTYTDPVQSTADRRYKLTVTHDAPISSGVPTSSQYLSIISEE